jgi:peroxiredoxin
MNKKSQLLVGIIILAVLISGAGLGYNYLTKNYKQDSVSNQTKAPEIVDDTDADADGNTNTESEDTKEEKVLAPDFIVYDEEGNTVKLSDYKGTPVVLNFWASWCPPCREEMPYFNKASKTYSKENVAILMVDLTDGQRETKEDAVQFMKDNDYEMKLLLDSDGEAAYAYNISAIPMTLFIDSEGVIVEAYNQGITENILEEGIKRILKN